MVDWREPMLIVDEDRRPFLFTLGRVLARQPVGGHLRGAGQPATLRARCFSGRYKVFVVHDSGGGGDAEENEMDCKGVADGRLRALSNLRSSQQLKRN
jgi:hypothetical protein